VDNLEVAEDGGEAAVAELDELGDVSRDGEGGEGGDDLLNELDLGAVPGRGRGYKGRAGEGEGPGDEVSLGEVVGPLLVKGVRVPGDVHAAGAEVGNDHGDVAAVEGAKALDQA
jgi:hypothetical protein